MTHAAKFVPVPVLTDTRYLGPAVVTEDEHADGRISLRLVIDGPGKILTARVAVPRARPLSAEDEVLVAGDPSDQLFVIGVLAPARDATRPATVETTSGAYATVGARETADDERLCVYSPRHELLFEYDPVTERARVNVARGCLELSTEDGDISLNAARAVRIDGETLELTGHRLHVKTRHAKWIVDRLETIAGTVLETAKNAYRTVEQLAQLKTGRMRTLVDETYQLKSKNAFVKSEEDIKITGDQIHLG